MKKRFCDLCEGEIKCEAGLFPVDVKEVILTGGGGYLIFSGELKTDMDVHEKCFNNALTEHNLYLKMHHNRGADEICFHKEQS